MRTFTTITFLSAALSFNVGDLHAWVINNWWNDGDNIVMDDVIGEPCFGPSAFSDNAQFQMSEWNEVDTTDNSHPFRVSTNPQCSFGANDGDNTIGFISEAGLNSEYGLSFSGALAWTVCWAGGSGGRYDECDVLFDPNRPWQLGPDDNNWFQSTALHELGHVRGLAHYNNYLSMQNSGTSKYLRDEILYMDDKEGVREHASAVSERDIVMYNKWHNGSTPQWMTMSPTTIRVGQTINLNNITVENRGTQSFSSDVWFGIYLSTNDIISTGDTLLNEGFFSSFGTFAFSTFNWSAVIPSSVTDCGTRWIGGIIDNRGDWSERFEGNNDVTFTNGVAFTGSSYTPTSLTILLAEDVFEPDDSTGLASVISLPFFNSLLSVDADNESDYFRVSLASTGTINIDALFSHSTGDINLQLLNSDGGVIQSSTSTTSNESITRSLSSGSYFVRVYGSGGGSCNRYTLDVDFTAADTTPSPNPMTWASVPAELNASQIRMTATTASDSSPPIEYQFDFTSSPTGGSGGSDSAWQISTTYTDSSLAANHNYCYRVRARDSLSNTTNYSSTSCDYTQANVPGAALFSNITNTSIQANWLANGNRAGTEYFAENTTAGTNSGWITSTSWTSTGLSSNTSYSFRVKARNSDGVETAWTSLGSETTSIGEEAKQFSVFMSGSQEVPPVATSASGFGRLILNNNETFLIDFILTIGIQDVTAAHIHCGPVGTNGPVGVTLLQSNPPTTPPFFGLLDFGFVFTPDPGNNCGWSNLADAVTAMRSGDTYLNVHTVANPEGEIRGQIVPVTTAQ